MTTAVRRKAAIVTALFAGAVLIQGPVRAQAPSAVEDQSIVVEAPRTLPPPADRNTLTGAPIVTTTVKISALYGDLDLTQPAAAARLMTRIERVARDACLYLDRLYPLNPDPACVDRAVAGATPAAQAIIDAAKK